MGNRKRKDLLSTLGLREPWERDEGEGRDRKGCREKCRAQQKSIKKEKEIVSSEIIQTQKDKYGMYLLTC